MSPRKWLISGVRRCRCGGPNTGDDSIEIDIKPGTTKGGVKELAGIQLDFTVLHGCLQNPAPRLPCLHTIASGHYLLSLLYFSPAVRTSASPWRCENEATAASRTTVPTWNSELRLAQVGVQESNARVGVEHAIDEQPAEGGFPRVPAAHHNHPQWSLPARNASSLSDALSSLRHKGLRWLTANWGPASSCLMLSYFCEQLSCDQAKSAFERIQVG